MAPTAFAAKLVKKGRQSTVRQVTSSGVQAAFFNADTSKPANNEALVAEAVKRFGALHIAVNNAGIGGPQPPTGAYPIDGWDKVIAVNLSGVFYGMRYQIPAIKAAGGGSIVNMASILGQVGVRNSAAYVAAKHGIVGLTKSAALEHAPDKIRVNAVGPGFIRTPLVEKSLDAPALKRQGRVMGGQDDPTEPLRRRRTAALRYVLGAVLRREERSRLGTGRTGHTFDSRSTPETVEHRQRHPAQPGHSDFIWIGSDGEGVVRKGRST